MNDRRPFLIGLSGPIGCGKSTVASMLGELGGTIIDADQLARRATPRGSVELAEVARQFGRAVLLDDGSLDRAALAEVVFADPARLADLEGIVHPAVRSLVDAALAEAARERVPFVVVEAIKLVEGGLAAGCDEVWLIDCTPRTQRRRMAARGQPADDIERRLAAQGADLASRLAASVGETVPVRLISTEAPLAEVREAVEDALADALAPLMLGG